MFFNFEICALQLQTESRICNLLKLAVFIDT